MTSLLSLANELLSALAPGCERIEVAGSLRRGSPTPKDIELVAIPKTVFIPNLFNEQNESEAVNTWKYVHVYNLNYALDDLILEGAWQYDPQTKRNGEKYKRLRHTSERNHAGALVACDLFIVNPRTWGIQFAIRTGPQAFSKALVIRAHKCGMFVDGGLLHWHRRLYKEDAGQPCSKGAACPLIIETPEEADFFRALDLPYCEPQQR